ncbi:MAG TPA: hypothetical protein PK948_08795 [Gemmatimonadales bacterium]|nr:hypothetical protein [Gemmatimonadales bacterium]
MVHHDAHRAPVVRNREVPLGVVEGLRVLGEGGGAGLEPPGEFVTAVLHGGLRPA